MRLSNSHYFNLQPVAKVIFGFIGSKRCKQQTSLVVDASHLLWTHSAGRHCSSCRSGTSSITLSIDRELFLGNGTSKGSAKSLKKIFSNLDFFIMRTYADTVVNFLRISALVVLIDHKSTIMLFKALFSHNFD